MRAIAERRAACGMSASEVARRASGPGGMSRSHVMALLVQGCGKSPRLDSIAALAESVGLELVIRVRP